MQLKPIETAEIKINSSKEYLKKIKELKEDISMIELYELTDSIFSRNY